MAFFSISTTPYAEQERSRVEKEGTIVDQVEPSWSVNFIIAVTIPLVMTNSTPTIPVAVITAAIRTTRHKTGQKSLVRN